MATYACTSFWEILDQGAGWTETWYKDVANSTVALTDLRALAVLRAATMGSNMTSFKLRVSNVALRNDSLQGPGVAGGADRPRCDWNSVGYRYRYESGEFHRCVRILRGLPDDAFNSDDPTVINDVDTILLLTAYHNLLSTGWRFRAKELPPAAPEFAISDVVIAPNPINTVTLTLPGHNFFSGQKIVVTGLRQFDRLISGERRITAAVPGETVTYRISPLASDDIKDPPYNGAGKAKLLMIVYPLVTRSTPNGWGDRQCGRPFDLQVGRQNRAGP